MERTYLCIDLKSYYASVECVDRGLDPMVINLVVADISRTEKTICLAVSPALKSFGVPGRARLFEVNQRVRDINYERRMKISAKQFRDKSCDIKELENDPTLELDFIIAPPRMAHYMEVSAQIYGIYLKYIAPEDIHVYSIDEVFMDLTPYLNFYKLTARELASKIVADVYETTGITATVGIGTNMYLAKVAMDILAKKRPADEKGMRIAELDEMSYRYEMWDHEPIRDFWRVGSGYTKKLHEAGLYTMVDKGLVADQFVLTVEYDRESLADPMFRKNYQGTIVRDHYGRDVPKHAHGTVNLPGHSSSSQEIIKAVVGVFDDIVDRDLLVRRVTISANHVISEKALEKKRMPEQLDLFTDVEETENQRQKELEEYQKEKQLQRAILHIHKKYGKNALLKGMNLQDGVTMRERNEQVGGHKA